MSDSVTDSNNGEPGLKLILPVGPLDTFRLDFSGPLSMVLNKEATESSDPRGFGKTFPRLTFGEKLVRTSFNPSNLNEVDDFKQVIVVLANYLHYSRMPEVKPDEYQPEYLKNAKKAVKYLELAQMFAVKAFTSTKF